MPNSARAGAVVFARDLRRVAKFYEALLGMPAVHSEHDHVVLESAHCELVIRAIPKKIADTIEITVPPGRRTANPIKLYFFVTSLAEARVKAAALGAELNPRKGEWEARGFRACDGHDPEGHVLQLRERAS